MNGVDRRWALHPSFILRSAGFPVGALDELRFDDSAAAIDALLDADEALAQAVEDVVECFRADRSLGDGKARSRIWKAVGRRRAVDRGLLDELPAGAVRDALDAYGAALAARSEAEIAARAAFDAELPVRRAALRQIVSDTRIQEAIWLSSPQMFEHGVRRYLERWRDRRNGEMRSLERQLASYVQRLFAKNETASFFGPVDYGDFASPNGNGHAVRGGGVAERRAFVAFWVVQAIAARIGADREVRPYLRPCVHPLAALAPDGATVTVAHRAPRALSAPEQAFLAACGGARRLVEVAAQASLDLGDALGVLDSLQRSRVVLADPELPITQPRALEALAGWVRALPPSCATRSAWLDELEALATAQDAFASAGFAERQSLLVELEGRAAQLSGLPPRRAGGELYADRLVVTEECCGSATPVHLGPRAAAAISSQLEPVLELLAAEAVARHRELTRFVVELVPEVRAPGGMPLLQFLQALPADAVPPAPAHAAMGVMLEQRIAAAPASEQLVVDPADLAAALDPGVLDREVLLASPDVMILADDVEAVRDGRLRCVVAECHDTLMLWGWALQFHDDEDAMRAQGGSLLAAAADGTTLANLLGTKRAKIVPFEYPGPTIDVAQPTGRADGARIPIADVRVALCDGALSLYAGAHGPMSLYNGELASVAHNVLAPPRVVPVEFGSESRTPRVSIGPAILQRARWRLGREELLGEGRPTGFELMLAARRAARRHELPRRGFVRLPGERKPVLLDLDCLFLLELLDHLAPQGTELTLTEMLPETDDLWLDGEHGRHCAELRLSVARARGKTRA